MQQWAFNYKELDKRFRELPYQAYMSEENPHKIALTMVKWRTMQWWNGAKVFEVLYTNKAKQEQLQMQASLF